jgi:putative ubiquitin-RnfH superfamily antitoxin RatB of RatAB toxin-antitoxin module
MFKRTTKKIEVQISRQGQDVETVTVKDGATVADALDAAGMHKKDTESIRVNQKKAEMDTTLKDGARIVLSKNISGGIN